MVLGTFSRLLARGGVAFGTTTLALVASLCTNPRAAVAQTVPAEQAIAPVAVPGPTNGSPPGAAPVVMHVDFGSGAPVQPPPPSPYAPPPPVFPPPPGALGPVGVAPGALIEAEERAEMLRQLQVADEYRSMRRGLVPLAHLGGNMAGLLVGSIPGAIIFLAGGGTVYSSTLGAGLIVMGLGGLTGSLFGGTWAAWSAGNRLGGHGNFWPTFGGTAVGYGGMLVVSLVAYGIALGGGGASSTAANSAVSAVQVVSYLVFPALFATVFYELSSEGVLGPMRSRLGLRYAGGGRANRASTWLTPTAMPLMSADGRMSGVGVGLAGMNF